MHCLIKKRKDGTLDYKNIILQKKEGIATVILNRPQKMNALNEQLLDELIKVVDRITQEDDIKVVVLTGSGKAFCAGGDVNELSLFGMSDQGEIRNFLRSANKIPLGLRNMAIPVIGAVNGAAMGAGFSLALACDIIIASEDAKFGQAFVNVGYHPDTGSSYFLPRLIGTAKACELIFTGRTIDAREAERIGIVSQIVPNDALMAEARGLALRIANGPSVAIGLAKSSIYQGLQLSLEQALEYETEAASLSLLTEDESEGIRAFREKRKPRFKGR